jgi:hypothetical protein
MSGQDGEGHRFIQGRPKAGAELGIKTVTWFSPRTEVVAAASIGLTSPIRSANSLSFRHFTFFKADIAKAPSGYPKQDSSMRVRTSSSASSITSGDSAGDVIRQPIGFTRYARPVLGAVAIRNLVCLMFMWTSSSPL